MNRAQAIDVLANWNQCVRLYAGSPPRKPPSVREAEEFLSKDVADPTNRVLELGSTIGGPGQIVSEGHGATVVLDIVGPANAVGAQVDIVATPEGTFAPGRAPMSAETIDTVPPPGAALPGDITSTPEGTFAPGRVPPPEGALHGDITSTDTPLGDITE